VVVEEAFAGESKSERNQHVSSDFRGVIRWTSTPTALVIN